MIGKIFRWFSNDWKKFSRGFRRLENGWGGERAFTGAVPSIPEKRVEADCDHAASQQADQVIRERVEYEQRSCHQAIRKAAQELSQPEMREEPRLHVMEMPEHSAQGTCKDERKENHGQSLKNPPRSRTLPFHARRPKRRDSRIADGHTTNILHRMLFVIEKHPRQPCKSRFIHQQRNQPIQGRQAAKAHNKAGGETE